MFSEEALLCMRFLVILVLSMSFSASGQQTVNDLNCSTLKYVKHTSAWLCGVAVVCSGDICTRPSQLDFDDQFDVVLRDKHGNRLDSKKLSYEHRKFCFEGRSDGDYQLAFVLYVKGIPQPARVFPTKYKRSQNKPNDAVYMVEATCPERAR